jgi:Ricin-type beta-trefoil lectin domain
MRMSLGKGFIRRRLSLAVLAVASSVALVIGLGLTPASAANGPDRFIDAESGLCLDGNSGGASYTLGCLHPDGYQVWYGQDDSQGQRLISQNTGRCLDSNYAGAVYTSPCYYPDTYQDWGIFPDGNYWRIEDVQTQRCLDSNNAGQIYTNPCWYPDIYQDWNLGAP